MNSRFKCISLVLYYVIIYVAGFSSQRRQETNPFGVLYQNPIAQAPDTETIEKWHNARQQIVLDLMERQRQMDEKKADAVLQIAEFRANRLQAHHELLKKKIHPDMFLNDNMKSIQHQHVNHQQFANNMLASQLVPVNDRRHTVHNHITPNDHGLDWTQNTKPVQDLNPHTHSLNDIGLAHTQIRFVSNGMGSHNTIHLNEHGNQDPARSEIGFPKNVHSLGNEVISERNIVHAITQQKRKSETNVLSPKTNIPPHTNGRPMLPVEHSTMGQFVQTASFKKSSSPIVHPLERSVISSISVVGAIMNSTTPANPSTAPDSSIALLKPSVIQGHSGGHTDTPHINLLMDKQDKHVLSGVISPSSISTPRSTGTIQSTLTAVLTTDNTTLPGVLSKPVDIIIDEHQLDIDRANDSRLNDSKSKTIGPRSQNHATDAPVHQLRKKENIFRHTTKLDKGNNIESTTRTVENVNDNHLHSRTNTSSSNSSMVSNRDRSTLMDILHILNVSIGKNQNMTTTKLLKDEHIKSILAKTVQDLSRLLSVDTQRSSPRVDVFHHIHVHRHDPHELPVSVPSSAGGIPEPEFTVNEMPLVDLTRPSLSETHLESTDFSNLGTLRSDINTSNRNVTPLQLSSVGTDMKENAVDINMSDSGFIWNGTLGEPADTLMHVDIIDLLTGKDMQSAKRDFSNNPKNAISDEATTKSRVIKTINGDIIPMPQIAKSSSSTGKTISVLSFLTDIRSKLKDFKNRIIKSE